MLMSKLCAQANWNSAGARVPNRVFLSPPPAQCVQGLAGMASAAMDAPQADVFVDALSSRPSWWAAATFVMAVVGFKVAMPTACSEVNACEDWRCCWVRSGIFFRF